MTTNSNDEIPSGTLSEGEVLKLALISEAVLSLLAAFWVRWAGLTPNLEVNLEYVLAGFIAAIPLLLANFLILDRINIRELNEFKRTVIVPLVFNISIGGALFIGVASGFAEELFFRGAVLLSFESWIGATFAVIFSSFVFSVVHFGTAVGKFPILTTIYFFAGAYLAGVNLVTGSLVSAMICHGFYNSVAIIVLRRKVRSSSDSIG